MSFYLYSINTGFYIKSGGYVGILNSNPQHALDISGSCKATNFIGDSITGRMISGETFTTQKFVVDTFTANNFTGQNFSGLNFTGNFFTGKNFYGGNFYGNNISGENIYAEHLIGLSQNGNFLECDVSFSGYLIDGFWNCIIVGTDLAGKIEYNGISSNAACPPNSTITGYFKKAYPFNPYIVISPAESTSALHSSGIYCTATTSHFVINIKYGLPSNSKYIWNYVVVGAK